MRGTVSASVGHVPEWVTSRFVTEMSNLRTTRYVRLTGSSPANVPGSDEVCDSRVAADRTAKLRLCRTVRFVDVTTLRAGSAGVARAHELHENASALRLTSMELRWRGITRLAESAAKETV